MILRPGLVIAPAVYGGTAMLRGLAALPWRTPMVEPEPRSGGRASMTSPRTVARCLAPGAPAKVRGSWRIRRFIRLGEIVAALRDGSAFRPRPAGVPRSCGSACVAALMRSAISAGAARRARPRWPSSPPAWSATRRPGRRPPASAEKPRRSADQPSSVQDRWFARLYFLKPLASSASRCSGSSPAWSRSVRAAPRPIAHLAATGFRTALAEARCSRGALFDVVLGRAAAGAEIHARRPHRDAARDAALSAGWAPFSRRNCGLIRSGRC